MTTTTHTQATLRELTDEETNAATGGLMGLGMAIATSIALQSVKDQKETVPPGSSRRVRAALDFIKG